MVTNKIILHLKKKKYYFSITVVFNQNGMTIRIDYVLNCIVGIAILSTYNNRKGDNSTAYLLHIAKQ